MGANIWPANAVSTNPTYQGRALRQTTVAPFVGGTTAARPFGAFSGVRPGTATNIVTATSTTWTVTPFGGVLDGESLNIAGPYSYSFDTNQTGSVTAAAGSARVDRLDVQVSDPAEADGSSTPGIAIIYSAGVAGTGVPVAAPARSHPLALINVPASGGGSPTVIWNATYTTAAGGLLPVTAANAAAVTYGDGQPAYVTDQGIRGFWRDGVFALTEYDATNASVVNAGAAELLVASVTVPMVSGRKYKISAVITGQIVTATGSIRADCKIGWTGTAGSGTQFVPASPKVSTVGTLSAFYDGGKSAVYTAVSTGSTVVALTATAVSGTTWTISAGFGQIVVEPIF